MMENGNPPPPIQDSRSTHITANLKDSLLTHLAKSNPSLSINMDDASSFIQQRLPQLFNSFHTPTHPPYALMIQNALKELNEENGSTEEAISEFIKKEYEDLPWAHVRILSVQLKSLCENEELVCNEDGRYVFVADAVGGMGGDVKETECKGSKKRKKRKKRGRNGKTERCESVERDNELQGEGMKEQIQVSELHEARTDEPSRMLVECIQEQEDEAENPLIEKEKEKMERKKRNNHGKRGRTRRLERFESVERYNGLQEEGIKEKIQVSELHDARTDEPSRMVVECIQEQNPLIEKEKEKGERKRRINHGKKRRKRRMERCESVEKDDELQEEGIKEQVQVSELHDARTDEPSKMVEEAENPLIEKFEEQAEAEKGLFEVVGKQSQSECHETGVIEHVKPEAPAQSEVEKSQIQDSALHLETICSSQQTTLNLLVDSQQPLLVPISEGLPKCMPSAGTELSVTQLQQQLPCNVPSESSLGAAAKMSASLSSLDVREHKQDEIPMSGDPEQQIPKRRCRGRPRKSEPVADYQGESLLVPISEGLPKGIPSAGIELSITQLQQKMPCNAPSECSLGAPAKMSASLSSLDVREHKQDESPMSGDPEQQIPKRRSRGRPRKSEPVADYQGESFLSSGDAIVTAQKPNINKIEKRCLSQPKERSTGQGSHPMLRRNAQQLKEQIQPQDQAQCMATFPYSDQNESINSSQATAPNFPVNVTHNFGQQLVVPISEGSPECIISTGTKSSPTELQLKISSDIDLVTASKMEASLACMNVHDVQLQHCNQECPKGNLDENPPKRPRGRPRKSKTDASHPGELPSDDGILNKQNANIIKIEEPYQYGQGIGRGRGRSPNVNRNANQCEDQLQQEDQAWQHGRGRGGDSGRGLGRPPKINQNANQCEETLPPQDQAQGVLLAHVEHSQWQSCQNIFNESAINSLSDANQTIHQIQPPVLKVEGHQQKQSHQQDQGWDQNQDLGQETPPNPMLDANQSHQPVQPQVKRRGRPRKPKQD